MPTNMKKGDNKTILKMDTWHVLVPEEDEIFHQHKDHLIEITEEWKNGSPAEVLSVYCECGDFFIDLMEELQQRYNDYFQSSNGNGVVITNPDYEYVRQYHYYYPIELKNKGLNMPIDKPAKELEWEFEFKNRWLPIHAHYGNSPEDITEPIIDFITQLLAKERLAVLRERSLTEVDILVATTEAMKEPRAEHQVLKLRDILLQALKQKEGKL